MQYLIVAPARSSFRHYLPRVAISSLPTKTAFSKNIDDIEINLNSSIFLLAFFMNKIFCLKIEFLVSKKRNGIKNLNETLNESKTKRTNEKKTSAIKQKTIKNQNPKTLNSPLRKLLSSFYPFYTNSSSNLNHVSHYSRTPSKEDLSPIRY